MGMMLVFLVIYLVRVGMCVYVFNLCLVVFLFSMHQL